MPVSDNEKLVRIQKVMANAGIASRREAERLIAEGSVTLNGQPVTLGQKMRVGIDVLEVNQETVRNPNKVKRVVYAFYKPKGCVTTLKDPQGRTTVRHFFPRTHERLFPVGRLDYDTEGLLFLTNDGDFAQQIMHPRHKIWKTYFVKVKGIVENAQLHELRKGPVLEGKPHAPTKIKLLHTVHDKTWLEISLQQGTNQQIKRMFESIGFRVLKIKRYRIGFITLGELTPGESRLLNREEISRLLGGE